MASFIARQETTFAGWLGTLEMREGRALPGEEIKRLHETWFVAIRNIELDTFDLKQMMRDAVHQIIDERIAAYKEVQEMQ